MKLKPISEIHASLGIEPNGRVQKFFTDTCARHMDKYIPMETGDLRTIVDKGADYITYESPYAHAQYIGIVNGSPVVNYTTPRNRIILGQENVERRRSGCNKRGTRLCQ